VAHLLTTELAVTGDELPHDPDVLVRIEQALLHGLTRRRRAPLRILVLLAGTDVAGADLR
jgi:hypothetical protein